MPRVILTKNSLCIEVKIKGAVAEGRILAEVFRAWSFQ